MRLNLIENIKIIQIKLIIRRRINIIPYKNIYIKEIMKIKHLVNEKNVFFEKFVVSFFRQKWYQKQGLKTVSSETKHLMAFMAYNKK